MDLKTLVQSFKPNTKQPVKEVWPGPTASETTPKITPDKFRRYYDASNLQVPAATTKTVIEKVFSYPVLIKQIAILVQAEAGGDLHLDTFKIEVDDNILFPAMTLGGMNANYSNACMDGQYTNTITGNLGATATVPDGLITMTSPTRAYITAGASPDNLGFAGAWDLDSYAFKLLKCTLQNVQAAKYDTFWYALITDRPIEQQYSATRTGP